MHGVLREEVAQATVEYAIVTVALLSIVLAIAVGGYLLRSISRPVAALTRGAERAQPCLGKPSSANRTERSRCTR